MHTNKKKRRTTTTNHLLATVQYGYWLRKNRSTYPGTPGTAVLRTVIYIHIIHTDGTMVPCGLHLTERCSKRTGAIRVVTNALVLVIFNKR